MKRDLLFYITFIVYVGGLFLNNMCKDDLEIEEKKVIDLSFNDSIKNQVNLKCTFSNDVKQEKE